MTLRDRLLTEFALRDPLFTTADAAAHLDTPVDQVSRALAGLAARGALVGVMRGLWAVPTHPHFSPYHIVGHLAATWRAPAAVSYLTALSLHGCISQVPPEVHVATTRRRPPLDTPVGRFRFHALPAALLVGTVNGDRWGRFALATPEKALFDTAYAATLPGARWTSLPELELPPRFRWHAWDVWIRHTPTARRRAALRRIREAVRATGQFPAMPARREPPAPPVLPARA